MARLNKEEKELAAKIIELIDNVYEILAEVEYNQWVSFPLRKISALLKANAEVYNKFADLFGSKEEGGPA